MKLIRHSENPILLPNPTSDWETYNVFNASVIQHNGLFHMHYRAQGLDWVSRIGYAVSVDGVHWNRLSSPVLEPENADETRGVEDPRVTQIEKWFFMAYTAYSGSGPDDQDTTPMFAKSRNLITWQRIGPLVRGEDNKDHFLLSKKLNGKFTAFHRRPPSIWLAESEDLISWPEEGMREIIKPRPHGFWDRKRVGGNGPPIETEQGWLMFYHGYNEDHTYSLGVCLLDLEHPWKVIHRPKDSIFEPKEQWELRGDVPRVVFSCANIKVGDEVYVYYGGADHVIGLAMAKYDELLDFAMNG